MTGFDEAGKQIGTALAAKHLCMIVGECSADYVGRATSKLDSGTRLVLLKGDGSISIHQNRLVRPVNYMVNTKVSTKATSTGLKLVAKRLHPSEQLSILFTEIQNVTAYDFGNEIDIRLSGSEAHLRDMLMNDLSFIEPGLKPINKEEMFRKGVVDIIAQDTKGRLVVIELKRRQADYACVTQLERYMRQVKQLKGIETRGILLAPSIRKTALELLNKTGLEYRQLDFTLLPNEERAEIKGIEKRQQKLFD